MRNILKRLPAALLLACALALTTASPSLFAQEEKAEAAKPSMEVWKWANFAILSGILGWLIAKNLGPLLVTRSQQIQEGLAAGVKAQADAEVRAAAVTAKLSGLGNTIATMRADAKTEREREGARIQRETVAELDRVQNNAAFEIESATKLARLSVQRFAAKLAIDLAEQKVRTSMSPDVQAALVQGFVSEIGAVNSAGRAGKLS